MMSEPTEPDAQPSERASRREWGVVIIGAALLLIVVRGLMSSATSTGPVEPGTPLPDVLVEGWLNDNGVPLFQRIEGKILVVDCWASWCGPCIRDLPRMTDLYRRYQPLGVEFIGLTREDSTALDNVRAVMRRFEGFDWPVGYGAGLTLDAMRVNAIPTVVVFGPDQTALWSWTGAGGASVLTEILDRALAQR